MTPAEQGELRRRMRAPVLTFAVLMAALAVNVTLGALMPFDGVWVVELGVALAMVVVVLLFSMEVVHEPPLLRMFAVMGFCWLAILFAMTLIDYGTR